MKLRSACVVALSLALASCASETANSNVGSVQLTLLVGDTNIDRLEFTISGGPLVDPLTGILAVDDTKTPPVWSLIADVPVGTGYTVVLNAKDDAGEVICTGSAVFDIIEGQTTKLNLVLLCDVTPDFPTGDLEIDATFEIIDDNICPIVHYSIVLPTSIPEGTSAVAQVLASDPDGPGVTVSWSAGGGSFGNAGAANTTYSCGTATGAQTLTAIVSDGDVDCDKTVELAVTCEGGGSFCGDGTVDAGETCDDAGESATCDADCTAAECGDGTTNTSASEECDTEGESATCDDDCTVVCCGDGNVNEAAAETCDDAGESATCDNDCTAAACGDGTTNTTAGEGCDDGNTDAGDGCSPTCIPEGCGNGVIDAGETCDDSGESATCDVDCTAAECGDGTTNATAGEACDTAGESATCDDDCSAVACGDGNLNTAAGEGCDDGNTDAGDGCSPTCVPEGCGNGIIDAGETCDDAGESATCDVDCTVAECGDGTTNATANEACDDSGESATCDDDCSPVACGDGTTNLTAGEECDDGNATDGDGCSANCTVESTVPDPVTVVIDLVCPTTIGLDVDVAVALTVTPAADYIGGEATMTTIDLVATQQSLGISLAAEISEASWTVDVANASPVSVMHTETFDPPLAIDVINDNVVDGGSEDALITPNAAATSVSYGLSSVGLIVLVAGSPLPVSCPVDAGAPTADFNVTPGETGSDGACDNETDAATLESLMIGDATGAQAVRAAGQACAVEFVDGQAVIGPCFALLGAALGPDATPEAIEALIGCFAECVGDATGFSDECSACYGGSSTCGARNCATPCTCLGLPSGCDESARAACDACVNDNCTPAFNECSGIDGTL